MITEDYVPFETAKLLKEKGFDEKCRVYYKVFPESRIAAIYHSSENRGVSEDDPNEILCPSLQMAMKWLREKHKLYCDIKIGDGDFVIDIISLKDGEFGCEVAEPESCVYSTYEEACEVAIKYCLENLI